MRIDVKKFLFIGLEEDKKSFFKQAQEIGVIDFIETQGKSKEIPQEISNLIAAIKILRRLPVMPQEELSTYVLADGLVHKILTLKSAIDKIYEDLRTTRLEIARIAIFGDFSLDDIHFIENEGHRKIQYFFAKRGTAESHLPEEVIFVGSEHDLDYFVAINSEAKQYDKLIEMKIDHPVSVLRRTYGKLENEIHEFEHRLKQYAKYSDFFHHALVEKFNSFHLQAANLDAKSLFNNFLFFVEAWIPVNKIPSVEKLCEESNIHMSEVAIESTDIVPTYLENRGINKVAEDVMNIYDVPSITDKDPSLWVLLGFAFFFAIIVGDAGYGCVFLATALYLRYKFSDVYGWKKRLIKLVTILSVSTVIWGLATNSIFGISLSLDNPLRKISLLDWLIQKKTEYIIKTKNDVYEYWVDKFPKLSEISDPREFMINASSEKNGSVDYEMVSKFSDSVMMELALFIGVIHIIISMLRYIRRNLTFIGWITFIVGCYLYIPHYLNATSFIHFLFGVDPVKGAQDGLYLIIGGIAIATLFSFKMYRFKAILEPMTAIQIFSDVMSYLRLYALGLAGSIVMATINESLLVLNAVFGIIVLIAGHLVNMALSIMGGVIHGLRLNFLEWYHYSFEGGGKAFKPLQKMKIE